MTDRCAEMWQMGRLKWIEENIGMTVNGGSKLWWTWQVEDGFKKVQKGEKYAIKNLNQMLTKQLNELVYETRNKLSSTQRKKVNTLIIIDVHARDIIDGFVRDSILDEREFAWESQLRFYWIRAEDDLFARQCTFKTPFGYEYMVAIAISHLSFALMHIPDQFVAAGRVVGPLLT